MYLNFVRVIFQESKEKRQIKKKTKKDQKSLKVFISAFKIGTIANKDRKYSSRT